MQDRKKPRRGVRIFVRSNLPPHPLDKRINALARELRRLVFERGRFATSTAQAGRTHTAEHVAKRAASHRGQKHPTAGAKIAAKLKGRKLSPAQRARISEGTLAGMAARKAATL